MNPPQLVQQAYKEILKHFVAHGRAPHYTELAHQLDIDVEEARILVRETAAAAPIASCWISHDTDDAAAWVSFRSSPITSW